MRIVSTSLLRRICVKNAADVGRYHSKGAATNGVCRAISTKIGTATTATTTKTARAEVVAGHPSPAWKDETPTNASSGRYRYFSSDSHDDFAPKKKEVNADDKDEALKLIEGHVTNNRVMLYMKGNPSMPMCGFSAEVVRSLQEQGVDFSSVNVLDYPSIREGVKTYANWPTIPQLYVDGEFIGGCDIITSMHKSGELEELLKPIKESQQK